MAKSAQVRGSKGRYSSDHATPPGGSPLAKQSKRNSTAPACPSACGRGPLDGLPQFVLRRVHEGLVIDPQRGDDSLAVVQVGDVVVVARRGIDVLELVG